MRGILLLRTWNTPPAPEGAQPDTTFSLLSFSGFLSSLSLPPERDRRKGALDFYSRPPKHDKFIQLLKRRIIAMSARLLPYTHRRRSFNSTRAALGEGKVTRRETVAGGERKEEETQACFNENLQSSGTDGMRRASVTMG